MKIVYFDVKDFEKTYFEKNLNIENIENIYLTEPLLNSTNLPKTVMDADVLCVFTSSRLTDKVLAKFKKIRLICTRSVGYSHINVNYCRENCISVATTPHYGDNTVAEFSFALLLDLVRKISAAAHDVKTGGVQPNYTGEELFQKTIGIFGTGAIGSKSARIAGGFSMKILANDKLPNKELTKKYNVTYVSFEEMCKHSDIIMLHAPLTKDNYHIFNDKIFDLMKKDAVIVNTARGELIDTKALYEALLKEKIKGAALDVVECEELFVSAADYLDDEDVKNSNCIRNTLLNHVLLNLKNVIITPHIAYDTKEATGRILKMTLQNLETYIKGLKITHLLDLHN